MKFLLALVLVASLALIVKAGGPPPTLCENITGKVGDVTAANDTVNAVLDGVLGTITTLGHPLRKFFDGNWGTAQSVNFTAPANSAQLATLRAHLLTFFYNVLDCPSKASFTNGHDASTFDDVKDLEAAHASMGIGAKDFNLFNKVILDTLAGLSVPQNYIDTISGVLNTTGPACESSNVVCGVITNTRLTVCDIYTDAQPQYTTNTQLVTLLVGAVVENLVGKDSPLKQYFDGTNQYQTTNFLTNTAAYNTLAGKLVAFFGKALGCSDADFVFYTPFPPGSGSEYQTVHQAMHLTEAEFYAFNKYVTDTAGGFGVDAASLTAVNNTLNTLKTLTVYQGAAPTTPTPTAPTAPTVPTNTPSALQCALNTLSCTTDMAACTLSAIFNLGKICDECWPNQIKCLLLIGADCYDDGLKTACEAACPNSKAKCASGSMISINFTALFFALLVLAMYFF